MDVLCCDAGYGNILLADITGKFVVVRGLNALVWFNISGVDSIICFNPPISPFSSFPIRILFTVKELDQDGLSREICSHLSVEFTLIEIPESKCGCCRDFCIEGPINDDVLVSSTLMPTSLGVFSCVRTVFVGNLSDGVSDK